MKTKTVLITGDIHGDFGQLNRIINKKKPDIVICCGDFGYWPGHPGFKEIKPGLSKIYWVPGNHERWDLLEEEYGRHGLNPIPMTVDNEFKNENIFYCPIGSTLEINDKTYLFVGGADSIDKAWRTTYVNWFPQEILNERDLDFIVATVEGKVDVVISHTCPISFNMKETRRDDKEVDPSRYILQEVLKEFEPEEWWFGHWHHYIEGRTSNCHWQGLDYPGHNNGHWWIWKT